MVQPGHIVAIYDQPGQVRLATAAGGEQVLKDMSVQLAAARVPEADVAAASG